jgi:NAD(P)H-quinone oxidoreductase subunit 5
LGGGIEWSLHYDGISGLMLLLVSFVGLVVSNYSVRYLDGDRQQGRFFNGVALTLGAVSLMVVSGNLAFLLLAWLVASLGLHQLLVHYPNRPKAAPAAWSKFAVSRLGDVFLLAALVAIVVAYGTLEIDQLRMIATAEQQSGSADPTTTALIAFLLVLGAAIKTAQFPFHFWLPETIDTPTPVSALMHAGIVNAGGFLVLRLSPLLVGTPSAMATLAAIGTVTVAYAAVVMLTQPAIKNSLAYSTIAQMGFMMLQCGLGAFSAAMLHIVAHSLYKAYAFLNSGSVLQAKAVQPPADQSKVDAPRGLVLGGALLACLACFAVAGWLGISFEFQAEKYLLATILAVAICSGCFELLLLRPRRVSLYAIGALAAIPVIYMAALWSTEAIVATSLPAAGLLSWVPALFTMFTLFCLFVLYWTLNLYAEGRLVRAFYVHAMNGFYIKEIAVLNQHRPGRALRERRFE